MGSLECPQKVSLQNVKTKKMVQRGGSVLVRTVAKDEQLLPLSGSDLSEERQQVERDPLGVLAHDSAGVRTARVEVPQQGSVPLLVGLVRLLEVVALGLDVVGDDALDHGFRAAVGVCRANWAVLGDGDHAGNAGGVAVDGRRGREDDVGDIVLGHRPQQRDAAADIDAVVFQRDLSRLAHSLVSPPNWGPSSVHA